MNDFEIIKQQYPLDQFITRVTGKQFKPVGSALGMDPCPFCGHKGCFRVWKRINAFKCFNPDCNQSGNIFSFSKAIHNIQDNFQNLKKVAEICGYQITNSKEIEQKTTSQLKHQQIFNRAAEFYQKNLEDDAAALKILSDTRNYTIKQVQDFNIGYSGKGWNRLYNHLKKDFNDDDLLASGLIVKKKAGPDGSENNELRDYFLPKLFVFPHYRGTQVCDFTIKDSLKHTKKDESKIIIYRLKAEYRLGHCYFYNQDALYYDELIIVEGEHDAIQIMSYNGKKNVLAITGNPSDDALNYLKRYIKDKTIYLCFDHDAAGADYEKQFFFACWDGAKSIHRLSWDGTAKDIDEYLRGIAAQIDPIKILPTLFKNAPDMLQYLISSIPDDEDFQKVMRQLEPFKEAALRINDPLKFEIALSLIKETFSKGKTIADFLKKHFQRDQLDQLNSADYLTNLPFYEKDGTYFHKQSRGPINLSNFRLHINDLVMYGEDLYYRCTLKSVAGEIAEQVEFSPGERADVRKFRIKIISKGAFHFTGRDNELSGIWQYEEGKTKARYIYYIQQYGYIKNEDMWLFENCAIKQGKLYIRDTESDFIAIEKKNYISHDVRVYSGARPKLHIKTDYTDKFCSNVVTAFHHMLDCTARGSLPTMAGYLFIGFIPAIIYSDQIFAKHGYFPLLFSYGPPGTGKTHATRLLLNFFGFMAQPESWPSASIAGTYQFVQQISSMPAWYDEFLNDKTFQALLGTIKNIYNRVGAGKGGKDERRLMREVNACLWLSGEDNPANEAVLSRSVLFRFTSLNPHKNKAYQYLLKNAEKLSVLTRNLIQSKSEENARILLRDIDSYQDYIVQRSESVDPRVAGNHAIVRASLNLLNIDIPEELDIYLVNHAERSVRFKEEENPRYLFFNEVNNLFGSGLLKGLVHFDKTDNEIWIVFEQVMRVIQTDLRRRGQDLRIKSSSVKDYLCDMPGFTESARRYFRMEDNKGAQKRCLIFNYNRLPEKIKESLDDVVGYEDQIT